MNYQEFLQSKVLQVREYGFEVPRVDLNPQLFEWQKDIVGWALRKGRACIFAECGTGKTPMQLDWARHVSQHIGGDVLILAPLAVSQQTVHEGEKFGIPVRYARDQSEVQPGITITNYERLDDFDAARFAGVVLDESSILKSYTGKYKRQINAWFKDTPYKLACTATPSPNDHMELLNHAAFLGVMESHEALSIWFINDSMTAGSYRLKKHAEDDFWRWVCSWAVSISMPSDLGYPDGDFILPPLHVHERIIDVDLSQRTEGLLFRMPNMSATEYFKEKKLTAVARVEEIAGIVNSSTEAFCVWCETNHEADLLKRAIPGAVEIRGSESIEHKEAAIDWFTGRNELWHQARSTSSITIKNTERSDSRRAKSTTKRTGRNETSTTDGTIRPISTDGRNVPANSKTNTTGIGESGTQRMRSSVTRTNAKCGSGPSEIPGENSQWTCGNTGLPSKITKPCSESRMASVPSVEMGPLANGSSGSLLTTTIGQEKSEDCSARTATTDSENSETTQPSSQRPHSTCETMGTHKVLISKASIFGLGVNLQCCHNVVFCGLSYSFESYYQAVRRFWRFGQKHPVNVYIVLGRTEKQILATIHEKEQRYREMKESMLQHVKKFQDLRTEKKFHMAYTRQEHRDDDVQLILGDCIEEIKTVPDRSVGLSVFSPPFSNLYVYSDNLRDMGNCQSDSHFMANFEFLIPELLRVTMNGRLCVVHCKDLPKYKNRDMVAGLKDFPGEIVRLFEAHGWQYHSRVTIWKDPVIEMQRTKSHGLLYKQLCKDSTYSRQGCPDYLVVFRKWAEEDDSPVTAGAERFDRYVGEPTEVKCGLAVAGAPGGKLEATGSQYDRRGYSIHVWQRYASPVWFDVLQTDVLNVAAAREDKDEKHICIARDSLVLTRDGYIPIQNVAVGDMVLTHQGQWQPVTAKRCNGTKPVVQTEAQGVPYLLTTPDHLLWARKATGREGGTSDPRQTARNGTPEWMRASETKASYINLRLPPVEESPYSEQEWWIVGRWLADGHFDVRGQLHISCGDSKINALTSGLGSRCGAVTKVRTGYQVAVGDRDGRLRALLSRCGRGCDRKKVPAEAICLDAVKAESLLTGYLSGDGHYVAQYQRWTASSVSRSLLLGMAMIAQRARGVVASVYAGRPPGVTTIEGRTVNTLQDWILSIPPRNLSGLMLEDGAWKKVRHVESAGEAEVWDLQVADDSSFTVEGCVAHNCPLQLGVCRRAIDLWSNPGDTVFSPFAGIGSEGYAAIELGRRFVGIELKEAYYQQAVRNIKEAQAKAQQGTLFAAVGETVDGK